MTNRPQDEMEPVSVLVCTRNRPDDIAAALPCLLMQDYPDYEVIVIDQSTQDDTARLVAASYGGEPRLRYVRAGTAGLSNARNMALAQASHALCAFTDDDCQAPPQWVRNLAGTFRRFPETAVLFSPVHIPPDLLGKQNAHFPCLYFQEPRVLRRGEIFGMGANMALRKSVWERVGPFDPLLGAGAPMPGAEEHDWLYRAHRAGAQIRLEPSNALLHRAWRTDAEWIGVAGAYARGDAAFVVKHLRCGDPGVIPQMLRALFYMGARGLYRSLRLSGGRYEWHYLRGYWQGIWGSMRYPVDRRTRLFRIPEEPCTART